MYIGLPSLRLSSSESLENQIAALFINGEQGWWREAENPDTLYKRRNLLTYSEQFDNAIWTKASVGVTPNTVAAPDGSGATADTITTVAAPSNGLYETVAVQPGAVYVGSVSRKLGTMTEAQYRVAFYDATNAAFIASDVATVNVDLGGGWYRSYYAITVPATCTSIRFYPYRNSANIGVATVHLWGAQLEKVALTTYQAVTDWYSEYMAAVGPRVTMFQDHLGVLPVTAAGQTAGLVLDRKHGLARGTERLTNGDFAADANWTKGAGWTIAGGKLIATGVALGVGADQLNAPLVAGRTYEITIVIDAYTAGNVRWVYAGAITGPNLTAAGTHRAFFTATGPNTVSLVANSGATTLSVDSVSVRELPGNHNIQATAADRPVLSARYNLLLATTTLATQSVTVTAASHKLSFTGTGTVTLSGVSTAGPLVGTGANNRVSLTFTPTAGSLTLTVTGSVTLADLRLTADTLLNIPAYQYVNTATDYTTDGFPHYFRLNGTNQSWATAGTVDFTGTDKVSLVYGVTKLSDAATGYVAELSSDFTANDGSFRLGAPVSGGSGKFSFASKGSTASVEAVTTSAAYLAPYSAVLTGIASISGDGCQLRVNNTVAATASADQGTGNFGNYTAYTGRRAGSSLPFNGRIYSEIAVGASLPASQLAALERYTARRMGKQL
jgi:hypothetical protein